MFAQTRALLLHTFLILLFVQAWAGAPAKVHAFFYSPQGGMTFQMPERPLGQSATSTPDPTQRAILDLVEEQGSITGVVVAAAILVIIVVGGIIWAVRQRRERPDDPGGY